MRKLLIPGSGIESKQPAGEHRVMLLTPAIQWLGEDGLVAERDKAKVYDTAAEAREALGPWLDKGHGEVESKAR